MKRALLFISFLVLSFNPLRLQAQESETKPWEYNIKIELKDSTLFIDLYLKTLKTDLWNKNYFLFNRYIKLDKALLNDKSLNYSRSNDTLYFESVMSGKMNFSMQYKVPCSLTEFSNIIKSFGGSTYTYPVRFDTNQIFFERFHKWYPVIYDNFSIYEVNIILPEHYKIYAYYPETSIEGLEEKKMYSFECIDEDFPFLITKSDIFLPSKTIFQNNTLFEFNFLPQNRRLLSVVDKKPVYTSNSKQMDSLYNVITNRSVKALDWYNTNLWKQQIDTLRFVETKIFGLGVCMNSFILIDRSLMNMEVLDNYAFSHEIGHLWIGFHTEYLGKGKYFLGESMNEYINLLYYESWAGKEAFENAIQDKINMVFSDKPFFTVSFEQVLNQRNGDLQYELIYSKGVVFVHEFCKMIGKDKLLKIVRETYSTPKHFVTLTDFENNIKANGCWSEYLKLYDMKL